MQTLRFSPFNNITPPMRHAHFHLHAALTGQTSKTQRAYGNREQWIEKYFHGSPSQGLMTPMLQKTHTERTDGKYPFLSWTCEREASQTTHRRREPLPHNLAKHSTSISCNSTSVPAVTLSGRPLSNPDVHQITAGM
jgi:hypothetical protein